MLRRRGRPDHAITVGRSTPKFINQEESEAMVSSNTYHIAWVAAAATVAAASATQAQVPLTTYMDAKGYLNVRALTCAQLANTYQEDANFLGAWYSGWWNGNLKRHSINIERAKQGLHEVIVYCKANPDAKVVDAVDAYAKKVMQGGQ
jgi:hypothetical protein